MRDEMPVVGGFEGAAPEVVVRPARTEDAVLIADLSASFVVSDKLVRRSLKELNERIHELSVATRDGVLVGCMGLSRYPHGIVVYNFCIAPDAQGNGIGGLLVDHAARLGRRSGHRRLLAASKYAGDWFIKRGFERILPEKIPDEWLKFLCPGRGSCLFQLELLDQNSSD
ncbi:GNAT family N-acetyltransferase [Streptomyces sp. NPDC056921]|uniref:GNAT family N-acetyltransferase n=1 Tax=Streptomyces sp. NPDC056921 TaxID=3345966 RepID=UPI0036398792